MWFGSQLPGGGVEVVDVAHQHVPALLGDGGVRPGVLGPVGRTHHGVAGYTRKHVHALQ